jgi:hypothetical protein
MSEHAATTQRAVLRSAAGTITTADRRPEGQ